MGKFLRGFALAYAIIVGLLILWSWCAVLASLHEPRELLTGPEWAFVCGLLASVPCSDIAVRVGRLLPLAVW
jgi:hypothetical protein